MQSVAKVDESLKGDLVSDFRKADISDIDKLILEYASRITHEPASIDRDYIDNLREKGMDDRMLHDIVQAAAYFNYVNRLADGLGVELEEG